MFRKPYPAYKPILLFLLILVLLTTIYTLNNKAMSTNNYQSSTIMTEEATTSEHYFNCIPGFTFRIPKFENWGNIKEERINNNTCLIEIRWSGFTETPPGASYKSREPISPPSFYFTVTVADLERSEMRSAAVYTNPQGMKYRFLDYPISDKYEEKNFIEFVLNDYFVNIEGNANDYYGFSKVEFWMTIAKSFKLTSESVGKNTIL